MPSANGVYTLPVGYLAVTGTTIQASQHNPPLEDIAAALTARLSRDGTAAMTGALQAAAGSAGAPSLTFATSNSTGFFKTTNGIGVAVGGTQVAEFLPGGINGARFIGELFDWTGSSAPPLSVLPVGQTLSRTAYAALWAFAQTEIAAGNAFYNNGDGSTTFGIGDCRGRVRATKDNMGGSAASRLTSTTVTPDGNTLGATGGAQTVTLTLAQIPTGITSTVTGSAVTPHGGVIPEITGASWGIISGGTGGQFASGPTVGGVSIFSPSSLALSGASGTSNNTGGAAHSNVQPTLVLNCALFAGA